MLPPDMHSAPRRCGSLAFTLVELLTVMAIISIIVSLSVPAIKSLGGAAGLIGAGNEVDGLLAGARQNSISKGVLTAVVVLGNPGGMSLDGSYRTITLLQLTPLAGGAALNSSNWTQVERWHVLPAGVIVDTTNSSFLSTHVSPNVISPPPPALTYKGVTYQIASGAAASSGSSGYYYQVFLPDGRLYQPATSPCTLQLTNGVYSGSGPAPEYTGAHHDYYNLICTDATGEIKILHP